MADRRSPTIVLPTWLAVLSAVLGIALLVAPIAYIAAIAFTFWCLVTGLVLYVQSRTEESPVPAGGIAQPGSRESIPSGASGARSGV